ncbi:MAG: hypothetical protein ABIN83_03480 [Sphingomicrobium sp.]
MIDRSWLAPLLEPRRPLRAILVGWLATSIPALGLAVLAGWLLPHAEPPKLPVGGLYPFLLVVAVSPLLETLIMALIIEMGLLFLPPVAVVTLSSIGWGVAHSLAAPAWGLVIWWPFLIFSTLYVTWRGRGRGKAIALVATVHALNNFGPALLLLRSA